jgi:hypothetical protein
MGIFSSKNEISDKHSTIINQQLTRNLAIAYNTTSILERLDFANKNYNNLDPTIKTKLLEDINKNTTPKISELTEKIIKEQIEIFNAKLTDIQKTKFVCNKYLKLKNLKF